MGPMAFLTTVMPGAISGSPCFPGSALHRRHMMFPEWLIGSYMTEYYSIQRRREDEVGPVPLNCQEENLMLNV
ncbi:Rest Corepressor 3 [Manis pentadactyla]|nr:Rest Corepressor 3 [Manis pentadactyla]